MTQTPRTVPVRRVASWGVGQLTWRASRWRSLKNPLSPRLDVGKGTLLAGFAVGPGSCSAMVEVRSIKGLAALFKGIPALYPQGL